MNLVDHRPINHHPSPPARWNCGVWQPESAEMKQICGGRKSNSAGNRRRIHWRKKFGSRLAPLAPRNTTSFIIRAKRCGGIASIVSPPCAVLRTPVLSPVAEVLVDMAKAEWGVNGYGTMKGLIRLRGEGRDEDEELISNCVNELSEFEVKEDVEVESRPELDLSRFELTYPTVFELVSNVNSGRKAVLESRLEYQEMQVARLEEEQVMINENLLRLEREMEDLKRRIRCLEVHNGAMADGSDSGVKRWEAGSEKSIGNGCDSAPAGL